MYSQVEQEIRRKISVEENIIKGTTMLKKQTDNTMVIQKCNTKIREARQNIEYLEETLKKLQLGPTPGNNNTDESTLAISEEQGNGNKNNSLLPRQTMPSEEHIFSRLDLVKYDCPSLAQKIQYMLQQLEFKLQVERQYQEANNKLTKLYQIDGDERSSSAAEGGALESKNRILLLKKALKKYQAINVDLDQYYKHDNDDTLNILQPKLREKQLTGMLNIGVTAIRDVDHIQSPVFARNPETFITVKVDDAVRARTKPSRNDRWNEEFSVQVDKGNEIEITIYDRVNETVTPVAVMWLLLSDIAEEIRKKKVGQTNGQGWVSAAGVQAKSNNNSQSVANRTYASESRNVSLNDSNPELAAGTSQAQITTNTWFVLEPAGQILLTLGFHKTSQLQRKNLVGGLHRHGAIINRKEEVYEQHGHHFVQKSFYNIMCCAYCGDFLRYSGFQCQDCKFLCHKKCYGNVVTKCISKTSTDTDPTEAKLNHHIPHRFEPVSNRGTKWCCHCGYILPWGKQKVRKCTECNIMCHTQCAHLVPDFCGMSMEMANKILKTIEDTKRSQEKKKVRKPPINHNQARLTATNTIPSDATQVATNTSPSKSMNTSIPSIPSPRKHPYAANQYLDKANQHRVENQDKLNTLINENDAYLQFTSGNNGDMVDYNTNMSEAYQQNDWDAQEQANENELALWKQHRERMERELQEEQRAFNEYDRLEEVQTELYTKQEPVHDLEPKYEEGDIAGSHNNPFRDMNRATFEQQQNDITIQLTEDATELVETVSNNTSPQKRSTGKHKKKASRRPKVSLDNFILLKVLGKGNFGKVILSKSKNTGRLCAIKVLKKDNIIQNHDIESARAEKKVFLLATKTKHPFLTNLYCSFQTENRIYFAMEFIGGGDLMWHVQNQRLSVRRAKFYAAEVLLALKYFHDNGVIYRDLKLENILLTPEGHIKIADYGLCKDGMWYGNKTSTFCGTPEFMAPELLREQEYTKAVDWWAFGVLLYQMLLCQSPFSGDDEDEVFNAILTDEPLYPIDMAGDIVQIFQGLLTKDPEKRLGAGQRDALEIMEEPFFRNINFDDMLNLRVKPPYIPEIKSPEDTSYFEQEFTSAPPSLTPLPSVLTTAQQEEFRGFSFMPEDLEL
ncbi:Protein kinase C-like 1 [Nakaseomyces bracarensis]|uniref:protein kinase C n=1 Tax=Nakaseomyces bracarensis TaxID=273131 RepID=A0ABR4NYV4_9SACH